MATAETSKPDTARELRYRKAAELMERWLSEASDYDEKTGELLDREIPLNGFDCGDADAALT